MHFDDRSRYRQSKTSTFSSGFCREIWIENLRKLSGGNPGSSVGDFDKYHRISSAESGSGPVSAHAPSLFIG